jgi:hypothetical protein
MRVLERARMRHRLRELRRARESMLLDLGALVYELHRHGKRAPELLQHKAAELTVVDDEVRELEDALAGREPEPESEPQAREHDPPTEEVDAAEADPDEPHDPDDPDEADAPEDETEPELAEETRS